MRFSSGRILFCLAFLVVCAFIAVTADQDKDKKKPKDDDDPLASLIRKRAPELVGDFSLNGKLKKLSDLKGKVVLVDFWAVWCGPCIHAFSHLRELSKEFKDEGLEVVGVTSYQKFYGFDKTKGELKFVGERKKDEETGDVTISGGLTHAQEQEMLKQFITHHKLPYRIMVLTQENWQKAGENYKFDGIPTFVLIDRLGVVRLASSGVSPDTFDEAKAMIKKLLAEK